MNSDIEKIKDMEKIKLAVCIPYTKETVEEKIEEIERVADKSMADIVLFPQEYFGGPTKENGKWKIKSHSLRGPLFKKLKETTKEHNIGLAVGLIEKGTGENKGKLFQTLWFFDSGKFKGLERKYNRAAYEMSFYKLSESPERRVTKKPNKMKRTTGTGILCWEAFNFSMKAAIYDRSPDWVLDAIKFPTDYYPRKFDEVNGITSFAKDEKSNRAWKEKLGNIATDCLTLVPYCSNATFSVFDDILPDDATPMAGIILPGGKVYKEVNGEGEFVVYDMHPYEIKLLRNDKINGKRVDYTDITGKKLPEGIFMDAKSWRIDKIYTKTKIEITRRLD